MKRNGPLSRRMRSGLALVLAVSAFVLGLAAPSAWAGTDLAAGKAATSDSAQAGRPAAHGNDGNAGTRWCAADSRTGHWWQVDLGAVADLTGVEVVWEFARLYRYRVDTSTDGTRWTTAVDRTANADASQTQSSRFTSRARYVRITVTGLPSGTWASFWSFRVFGVARGDQGGPAPDPALRAECTGTAPITCHYDLAPGHYDLTLVLGDATRPGVTEVQGEARRTLLPPVTTAAGEFARYSLTVDVRQPEGQPTGQGGTGTPGLNLVFTGSAPRLDGIGIAAAPAPLTLYLAGDSTVCDQPTAPYAGWGQVLPRHFTRGLSVANYGDSGESSGSFLATSALFPTMRPLIRSGDVVLIQFGHNDKSTTADTFSGNLTSLVDGVRARGGAPVLVTPPVRRHFDGSGRLTPTALHVNGVGVDLPAEIRATASSLGVPLLDLTARSKALVEGLGPTASQRLYLTAANDGVTDNTHFSVHGAGEMANLVLQEMRLRNLTVLPFLR